MLVKLLEREIKRFERLFEQTVADLGEVPKVPAVGDEPNTQELEREIDDRVDFPYRQEFVDRLRELLGYDVEIGEEGDDVFNVKVKDNVLVMRFVVDEGEPLVIFRVGDQKVTGSLYLLLGRTVVGAGDILEALVDSEEAMQEFVDGVKGIIEELIGIEQVVEEEPVGEEPVEGEHIEEEPVGEEGVKGAPEGEGEGERAEESRMRRVRRFAGRVVEQGQKKQKKSTLSDLGVEVKKVADTEVKYEQVDVPMEAETAKTVMKKMTLQDIAKKVSPGEGGYPDIIGWVTEPKEQ